MRSAAIKLSLLLAMLACGARISTATRLNNAPCTTYMDCPMQLPCGRSGNCFIMDRWGDNPVGAMASTPMVTPTPIIPTTPVSVPAATPATTSNTPATGTGSPATTTAAQFVTTGTSTSGGSSTPAMGGGSTTTTTPNLVSSDAQGFGDPQFIGLDGRMFFFDGLPHKYFNLVSEENHQLNALFVPGPHKISALGEESDGTFLGEFGLKAYGTVVTVKVDEQGYMSAIVNGEKMGHDELATHQFSRTVEGDKKVTVVVEEYRENLGQAVTVITPLLEFIFFPTVRHWDPEFNQTTRGHLNLALSLEMDDIRAGSLHGVLGQTTPDRAPVAATLPDELQTLFLGEGKPEDYQVSSLLADDFKYNQYRGGEQTRRSNTAWREADNQTA